MIDKTRLQRQFNNQDKACFHTPMPPYRVACANMHVALRVCILSSDVAFCRQIVCLVVVQCWAFAFMLLRVCILSSDVARVLQLHGHTELFLLSDCTSPTAPLAGFASC